MTCHNSLKQKKPKMPAQACANGLALPKMPPELQNLSDMERRIISLRIPFMVIFCLVRYGSQYKIRGGCTNVPTSLDQVVNMLPRMSHEIQFHPMKLKKKMNYKSNYMYKYIRKDVVISAIKWLKENNKLYGGVELNVSWADEWLNSEFSSFLSETDYNIVRACDDDSQVVNEVNCDNVASGNVTVQSQENRELVEDQKATDANTQLTGRPTSNIFTT